MADETKLEITLQGEDLAYVESRLSAEEGATPSSYIADLIAYDKEYQRLLEERLVRALESERYRVPEQVVDSGNMVQWLIEERKKRRASAA